MDTFDTIVVDTPKPGVGLITLNRPKSLNALNSVVESEILAAATAFDSDPSIGAIVITGGERAFAAGADISEMASKTLRDLDSAAVFAGWDRLATLRTPLVAAVSGYALGGGCELAMLCDLIIASDTAKFGQPEIKLGILPGFGGTQRLIRAVGKAKAMDMCLTGRMIDAHEAERAGLVARVVTDGAYLTEAIEAAATMATMSKPALAATKQALNSAFESPLAEGIRLERTLFKSRFATADQKEGMAAFLEKREPDFTDS
ncbi:enoyl-CoA hydratase [Rhodococcus sp. 14-2496-1d]|uniref:enoyl-CoA hydratase-related protein n=1 Tax=Rhodococcus sp. 14-2496-1d TaxID=2023146 RepID=UPI000B9BE922|nr:enoyl-CoA hydratase-related protein [Rhodococcus sp. 14-2496-1d]OZF25687.1 enoyl-CoA hydratase [Rhodococcus sp. 14-2496-1d]